MIQPLLENHRICLHKLHQVHLMCTCWCLWHVYSCIFKSWGVPQQCLIERQFWWGSESSLFIIFLMSCLGYVSHCIMISNQTNLVVSYLRKFFQSPRDIISFLLLRNIPFYCKNSGNLTLKGNHFFFLVSKEKFSTGHIEKYLLYEFWDDINSQEISYLFQNQ